ncbi:MAG: hypothetical protein H0U57_05715 [Tatlockia sp.]|nr:hypothetical protein [Tatlockia sp.]
MFFHYLNKLLGSAAGLILYPIKSLLITLVLIALNLVLLPLLLIGVPIAFAVICVAMAEGSFISRFTGAIFTWLLVGTVSIVVFPVMTLLLTASYVINGTFDFFKSVHFGLQDGYQGGLFFNVINRLLFDILVFNTSLQRGIVSFSAYFRGQNPIAAEGLNALYQEEDVMNYFNLEDIPRSSVSRIPELHEQPQAVIQFNPLTIDELQQTEKISALMGNVVAAYKSLDERLTALDEDMASRTDIETDLDNVMDEVIMVSIKTPCLLVKQYQDEQGRWRVIPDRTKIIDKPSWDTWLGQNNCHPETREQMDNARSEVVNGENKLTRYRIRPYTNKNDSQELIEASLAIRTKLIEVNPANIQVDQVVSNISSTIRETFFGNSSSRNHSNQDERPFLTSSL